LFGFLGEIKIIESPLKTDFTFALRYALKYKMLGQPGKHETVKKWDSHMLYLAGGTFGWGVFFSRGGLNGAGNGSIKLATDPGLREVLESAEA